jgi:hypothetical protein
MADDLKLRQMINSRRYKMTKKYQKPIDLDTTLNYSVNAIYAQIKAITELTLKNPILDEDKTRALVNCVKVLKDLRRDEDMYVAKLSPEERKALSDISKKNS